MENENEQTVRPKRMKTPKNMGEKQQTKQTKNAENQPLGAQAVSYTHLTLPTTLDV